MELTARMSGGAVPAEHMNLFTAAAGGPVPFPWGLKKKTFFEVAYEPLRYTNVSWTRKRLLTPDEIAGKFYNSYDELNTTLLKKYGYAYAITQPRTGGQFYDFPLDTNGFPCGSTSSICTQTAGTGVGANPSSNRGKYINQLDNVHIPNDDLSALLAKNPVAQFLFSSQPTPGSSKYVRFDNSQGTYSLDGYNGYGARGVQTIDNRYTFRIDENISDRDRVFFRYTPVPISGKRYDYMGISSPLDDIPADIAHARNITLNYVRVISPRMVNEVRATYIGLNDTSTPHPAATAKDFLTPLGLPAPQGGVVRRSLGDE